jgi:hypothetical protein
MSDQCQGCAFKEGSEANREPHNNLKAQLCAHGGVPFYCHAVINWRDPKMHGKKTRKEIREGGFRICGGWKREVAQLARAGFFGTAFERLVKRAYAESGLEALVIFCASEEGEDKEDARRQLFDIICAFKKARRKVLGR